MRNRLAFGMAVVLLGSVPARAGEAAVPLAPGVRGLITRAAGEVKVDGKLNEWSQAFCTPVHYNHKALDNRAGQFFYMWDDEAFYIGLRCLDRAQANASPSPAIYNGDAVEFYLDTRAGDSLRRKDWTTGAIHFYYSPFQGTEVKPRWAIRSGIPTSNTVLSGIAVGATRHDDRYEVEFKLPWANFPGFQPKLGAVLALDAELCSSDGKQRVDRTFAYGSPLSVQQPASLGKVELVKDFDPEYLTAVGAAAFPMWVDTPAVQAERGRVQAVVAIPPSFTEIVGEVEVRLHDTDGKVVRTVPAKLEPFGPESGVFLRAVARWSIDDHAPGTYFATAVVRARTGKTLVTVAPRMVAEAITPGR